MYKMTQKETKKLQHLTLAEIYAYAEKIGFTANDVEIDEYEDYFTVAVGDILEGHWWWTFEDIEGQAIEFEFEKWIL